ncbi:MAG: MarR family transcriptional regulator [Candidatus Obscuribacterales bacterium]|nr:MarR family transcriptional regulator [Candidatus Obscuribacterales bacterium]
MSRPSRKNDEQLPVVPESLSHSIGFLLNFNGRIIRECLEQVLEPLNLSLRELGLMRILESEGPLSQHVLGRRHNVDRTTTVQIIDELESRQLVIRSQNLEDRRSNLLFLTPRGRKTLSRALKLVNKEQNVFLAGLEPEESEALRAILLKLLSYHLSGAAPAVLSVEQTHKDEKAAASQENDELEDAE